MTSRVVSCFLVLTIAGCGEEQEPAEVVDAAPFAGVKLEIAVPAGHDFPTRWQVDLNEWSVRTGAAYDLREVEPEPTEASTPAGAASPGRTTLLILPITQTAAHQLAPIPEAMQSRENLNIPDLFEGLRQGPASVAGRPAVLPIASPVLVYYYRRDIFEREGLSPPQSWQEHQKLIEELHARNLTAVEPWNESFRATMFLARAVSYAKHPHQYSLFFDVETGQPLIDTPGFVRALEDSLDALNLLRARTDVTKLSPADCRRMILSGEAAVAITFEPGGAETDIGRPESARIGCVRLPGHEAAWNRSTSAWESQADEPLNHCTLTAFDGWCAAVSAGASPREQQAAWELLRQIAVETPQLIRTFPPETRSLCRESQLSFSDAWVGEALSPAEAHDYLDAVAASLRHPQLVAELPVLGRSRFRGALTAALGRVLAGETTPAAALKDAAAQWRSIAAELGPLKVKNSYRKSIGLLPRTAN